MNLRKNKFNNKETIIDNISFSSAKEAERYKELKLLLKAGKIQDLELQPRFLLQDSFRKNGKTYRKVEYVADFKYTEKRQNNCRRRKRNTN